MKVYLVGGAVRDKLLGKEPKDKDYVVVGSTPDEMLNLGYKQVGADFPVFLHPDTGEEYALARKERKTSEGYNGFECDWEGVTLEEDLSRRDLTINSMAQDIITGEIIDPFGGQKDLEDKILRPTTEAFKEDPLRVLRAARFYARYISFTASDELLKMCKSVENSGELENLVPERVWLETAKALKEEEVSRYFEFLVNYKMPFTKIFRSMKHTVEDNPYHQEANVFIHTMMVAGIAHALWKESDTTFACLLHDIAKPYCYMEFGNGHGHDDLGVDMVEEWCTTFRVPKKYKDLAKIVCKQHQKIHTVLGRGSNNFARPKSIMKLFEDTAAINNPERFSKVLKVCQADSIGRVGISCRDEYHQRPYLEECLKAAISVDTKKISASMLEQGKKGTLIGEAIRVARIDAIRGVQVLWKKKLSSNT